MHPLSASRELYLAGLLWPGEPGLTGHSDGDVAAHAVCDALLSAAPLLLGTDGTKMSKSRGNAIALVEVDGPVPSEVIEQVKRIPHVQRVQPLRF